MRSTPVIISVTGCSTCGRAGVGRSAQRAARRGTRRLPLPPPPLRPHPMRARAHLDARVHLHKIKALGLPQELDRAHPHIADRLGGGGGGVAHGLAHLRRVLEGEWAGVSGWKVLAARTGGHKDEGRQREGGRQACRAAPRALARTSGVRAGEGASSSSFWLRRWMEQSRSPRCTTLPNLSASTCAGGEVGGGRAWVRVLAFHAAARGRRGAMCTQAFTTPRPHPRHSRLELDVPRVLHKPLQVDVAVAKRGLRLLLRLLEQRQVLVLALWAGGCVGVCAQQGQQGEGRERGVRGRAGSPGALAPPPTHTQHPAPPPPCNPRAPWRGACRARRRLRWP